MSHQTGISASESLQTVFKKVRSDDNNIRLIKVKIENEKLEFDVSRAIVSENWEHDFDQQILPLLKEDEACYILYRLHDNKNWLLICFTPDNAPVRQKMLYAATKATLKTEFGVGLKEEFYASEVKDANLKGYEAHIHHVNAPAPLTYGERELKLLKENEVKSKIGVDTRHQTVQGLQFPLDNDLLEAIDQYKNGYINYIQIVIDIDNEVLNLSQSGTLSGDEFGEAISTEVPQYHVFQFNHTYEGENLSTNVFVYSMPGYSVPIKSRMLFSSCKGTFIDGLEQDFNIIISKRIELDVSDKLTEQSLYDEIHPPKVEEKKAFSKPKAPGRSGGRRPPKRN